MQPSLMSRASCCPRPSPGAQGVRRSSVVAARERDYAVADIGELKSWGFNGEGHPPLALRHAWRGGPIFPVCKPV
jgi:hypothetical protein